jgi:hypothetical protein
MTRKRTLLVVAVLSVGIAALWYATTSEPGPTKLNFDRLHAGEPRSRFEAVLGPPNISNDSAPLRVRWVGNEAEIYVSFAADSGVAYRGWIHTSEGVSPLQPPPPSTLDRIKALLHL